MLKLFATHNIPQPFPTSSSLSGSSSSPSWSQPFTLYITPLREQGSGRLALKHSFRLGMRRPTSRRLAPSWQEPLPLQTVHSANTTCALFPELHALYVWLILHNLYCINMHKLHEIVVFAHAANVRRLLSASKCPASRVCCLSLNRVKPLLNHVRSAEVQGKHFQALPKHFPNTIHQHSSKTPVELQLRSDRTLKGSNKT